MHMRCILNQFNQQQQLKFCVCAAAAMVRALNWLYQHKKILFQEISAITIATITGTKCENRVWHKPEYQKKKSQ